MPVAEYKCKRCNKWQSDHKAQTFNCPTGTKTRIGYTQYTQSTFEPNPFKSRMGSGIIGEPEVKKEKHIKRSKNEMLGDTLADALNLIKQMPAKGSKADSGMLMDQPGAKKPKAKKKSAKPEGKLIEDPSQQSLLMLYEMFPEEVVLYFVPQPELLPKNLLGAIRVMENVYVNGTDMSPKQYMAFNYLNASLCEEARNLDEQNPNDCNRFAHKMVPFKLERGQLLFNLPEGRALRVIRTGFLM
jgi:hypothetical protein